MARILESGIAEMQRGQMFRTFVDQASSQFDALGTPEAQQIAQLIRSDPRGATAYVNQFGGWEQIYNQARANAGRQALTEAIGRLSPANGAATSLLTQQQVLQQILPVVAQYGVGADMLNEIAQAFGAAGPREFDWEHSDPARYTPESYAAAWQAQDPTLLRAARKPGDQLIGGKYLQVLDAQGNIVRAQRIPGMDYGEEGGRSAEARALDLESKKLDLRRKQAEEFVRKAYEDDAAGLPITAGRARLVNNLNRMYPDLAGNRPQFAPVNLVPDGPPVPVASPDPAAAAEERLRVRER